LIPKPRHAEYYATIRNRHESFALIPKPRHAE